MSLTACVSYQLPARDWTGCNKPSLQVLHVVPIRGKLPFPSLGILQKCAFLVVELAQDADGRVFLEHAATLSLSLIQTLRSVMSDPPGGSSAQLTHASHGLSFRLLG
jgi:hypothetical protein